MAVQIFYQSEYLDHAKNIDEIKNDTIENYALELHEPASSYKDKIDQSLLNELIAQFPHIEKIDEEIQSFMQEGYLVEKLNDIMRQILRLGAIELKFMKTPFKVVIDEYVDIASAFFDKKHITFTNAVLDNIAKKFRKEEFPKVKNE